MKGGCRPNTRLHGLRKPPWRRLPNRGRQGIGCEREAEPTPFVHAGF
jgi:hypothetical protein